MSNYYSDGKVNQTLDIEVYDVPSTGSLSDIDRDYFLSSKFDDKLSSCMDTGELDYDIEDVTFDIIHDNELHIYIKFIVYVWEEGYFYPGVHTLPNGDPGYPDEYDIIDSSGALDIRYFDEDKLLAILKPGFNFDVSDIDISITPDISDYEQDVDWN